PPQPNLDSAGGTAVRICINRGALQSIGLLDLNVSRSIARKADRPKDRLPVILGVSRWETNEVRSYCKARLKVRPAWVGSCAIEASLKVASRCPTFNVRHCLQFRGVQQREVAIILPVWGGYGGDYGSLYSGPVPSPSPWVYGGNASEAVDCWGIQVNCYSLVTPGFLGESLGADRVGRALQSWACFRKGDRARPGSLFVDGGSSDEGSSPLLVLSWGVGGPSLLDHAFHPIGVNTHPKS
ncbi:MAG: hypothetical protein ACO4CG_14890, partial [Prochlorothrix sp.]